jgi:D-glycero-beta-D-manno-heptose-7-phosphate kinase
MSISLKRVEQILRKTKNRRILVVGDLMLDRFIWGKVSRISPEAPIPVVEIESTSSMPGGAANVVNNICALDGRGIIAGVAGKDRDGIELIKQLKKRNADVSGIILSSKVETIVKTRVIAHHQHVVRIDRDHSLDGNGDIEAKIIKFLQKKAVEVDAVILEDYGKGVLTERVVKEVVNLSKKNRFVIAADPKIEHEIDFSNITVITPNLAEACYFAGRTLKKIKNVEEVGKILLEKWKGTSALITLGEKGMCLFQHNTKSIYIETKPKDVFDVAGAGDTVIAVLTLALASGASLYESAVIANIAAGVVVQKSGVNTVTCEEIMEAARTELQK